MAGSLQSEASSRGIPFIGNFRELELVPETYEETKIIGLVNRFAQDYGDGLVLYGGITATEWIYGLKRIRSITSDLDFVCTPKGIGDIMDREQVVYHSDFDILFMVADNVPVSFTRGHIHDWQVGEDFFAATETRSPFGIPLRCASREHSIMLKMRRSDERMARGEQPFGKDALDILNMLASPYCGRPGETVDIDALCGLVRGSVTSSAWRLDALLRFIGGYEPHLSEGERLAVDPALAALREGLFAMA